MVNAWPKYAVPCKKVLNIVYTVITARPPSLRRIINFLVAFRLKTRPTCEATFRIEVLFIVGNMRTFVLALLVGGSLSAIMHCETRTQQIPTIMASTERNGDGTLFRSDCYVAIISSWLVLPSFRGLGMVAVLVVVVQDDNVPFVQSLSRLPVRTACTFGEVLPGSTPFVVRRGLG